jgi:tripartite-type tricarboxylate transporter receptor subunit TctC
MSVISGLSISPTLYGGGDFDPMGDFIHISIASRNPSVLVVNPSFEAKTFREYVAYAKANPGKLSIAHGNSTGHITIEALKARAKIDIARVPYRSNPVAMTDLIAGHVPLMVPDFGTALPQLKAQKIRPLAVLTKERSATLPDLATLHETVMPNFDLLAWAGMFAPAGLPAPIAERISGELQAMLSKPEVKERLLNSGVEVFYTGPQAFDAYVKSELVKWTGLIKEVGIQPE